MVVAKEGKGGMAVANAIGSNVFDICLGLGIPYFIATAMALSLASISPRIAQDTLDSISAFLSAPGLGRRDMVHLAYIMYVPGLSVETLPNQEHIVRLQCNADSVLGTTAYVISRSGLDTLLGEHRRTGYVDAIPNMMARLFPDT